MNYKIGNRIQVIIDGKVSNENFEVVGMTYDKHSKDTNHVLVRCDHPYSSFTIFSTKYKANAWLNESSFNYNIRQNKLRKELSYRWFDVRETIPIPNKVLRVMSLNRKMFKEIKE